MSVISGEENIHPVHVSLHDVIRTIWNDPAGISPEFRQNYYLRHILNDWNALNSWNQLLDGESVQSQG